MKVSVYTRYPCLQTDSSIGKACRDVTGADPQGRLVVNEEGPRLRVILAHLRR